MNEADFLAERFEEHRSHLRAVAYRMLGSLSDVDDAVQEAWLRLSRTNSTDIGNLGDSSNNHQIVVRAALRHKF